MKFKERPSVAKGDCVEHCGWSWGTIYSATDGPGGALLALWMVRGDELKYDRP
jgi:hypothetical protein